MSVKSIRVFLSSTAEDLRAHREKVALAIQTMGQQAVRMETFGAQPQAPVEACKRQVASADVVVVIVAWRYGWVPTVALGGDDVKSITRIEVEAAKEGNVPVLAFVVDPVFAWPHKKEQDALVDAQSPDETTKIKTRVNALKDFKAFLGASFVTQQFTTEDDLATKVCAGLGRWLHSNARAGAIDLGDDVYLTAAYYANEAYLRFTVSNLSDAPQKVTLALDVMESTRSKRVAVKKAGAILRDYDLDASLIDVGRADLLAGRDVQIVLGPGQSDAFRLRMRSSEDGKAFKCRLVANFRDVARQQSSEVGSEEFMVDYPHRSAARLSAAEAAMADHESAPPLRCSACGAATPLTAVCTWVSTETQLETFSNENPPPPKCPQCGAPLPDAPAVLVSHGWTGVVLANPQRLTVFEADATVSDLLASRGDASCADKQPVVAVGRRRQMRQILHATAGTRFSAVSFNLLACRDWVNQLESLMVLFDCYLQNDCPLQAFGLLCEACNEFKELVLHPRVFEAMELALVVARQQDLTAEQRSGMEEDFEQVETLYRQFHARLSPTARARHLCFFRGDSDFEPYESINYLVELVAMDRSGRPDFEAAELHVTNEPMQAVLQDKPTLLEWATLELFVLGIWAGMSEEFRAKLPLPDQRDLRSAMMAFSLHWSLVRSGGRYQLYKWYQERSGGRDLVIDFNLPPEGIYLTIDRIESSASGRADD